jgi:hypothetical protein
MHNNIQVQLLRSQPQLNVMQCVDHLIQKGEHRSSTFSRGFEMKLFYRHSWFVARCPKFAIDEPGSHCKGVAASAPSV